MAGSIPRNSSFHNNQIRFQAKYSCCSEKPEFLSENSNGVNSTFGPYRYQNIFIAGCSLENIKNDSLELSPFQVKEPF